MEEIFAPHRPINKYPQVGQKLTGHRIGDSPIQADFIEQLQESNRKLEKSLKELQERHQKLLDSNANTSYSKNPDNIQTLDSLAYLSNKSHLISEIDAKILNSARSHTVSSLIIIRVNSILDFESKIGRSKLNIILKKINHFLKSIIHKPFTAARLDDHLYALLLDDCKQQESVKVATLIKNLIYYYMHANTYTASSSICSIGITPIGTDATNAEEVLFQTEVNLNLGSEIKSPDPVYRAGELISTNARDMMPYLTFALQKKRFRLLFQPLVNLKANTSNVYEVLTRMLDSDGNDVPAEEFIPLAHLNGLGEALDKVVLEEAFNHFQNCGQTSQLLMITITNNSLVSPTFLSWLSKQLALLSINPTRLILQMSEIDICNNIKQAIEFYKNLDKLGLQKAVCHFSASKNLHDYLDAIKPDYIKLDREIFCNIIYEIRQKNRVKDIINNLHHKGYRVMASQIENIDLLPALWTMGADFVQGYCLQEPLENMDYPFIQEIQISDLAPRYGIRP